MVNIKKVVNQIKFDGKYDALLDMVKEDLDTDVPTIEQIRELVESDDKYIIEYKDLNRWGELSSVHIKTLYDKPEDSDEVKDIKRKINSEITYLKNNEEYEVKSKKVIYLAWTGFIALPSIYVIDNIARSFTSLYTNSPYAIYFSFILVSVLAIWGYLKAVQNHKHQHQKYINTQQEMRKLIRDSLDKGFFTYEEVYED